MTHRANDRVKLALLRLNRTHGMPWSVISLELGIPQATLWDVANGKPVPRKWRAKLGLRRVKDLYALPVRELRWAIEHRKEG